MRVMRNITITTMLIVVLVSVEAIAQTTSRSGRTSIGRGVVPPSSLQRGGLIRSPNPMDTSSYSSNDIVTGNVAGNKYFRGVVPYNSFSYLSAPTGTETVDSFLRYSGGGELYGRYTGDILPYYAPSRTVTTTSPGGRIIGGQTAYSGYLEEQARLAAPEASRQVSPLIPTLAKPRTVNELSGMYQPGARPMSMSLEEMEKLISAKGELSPATKQVVEQQRMQMEQEQLQRLEEALKQAGSKAAELQQKLERKGNILQQTQEVPKTTEQFNIQPEEEQAKGPVTSKLQTEILTQKPLDVFEQMKQQLAALQEGSQPVTVLQSSQTADKKTVADGKQIEKLSPEELSSKAKNILGEYKTFASYSQSKFNRYMLAGEQYLKQGKYYLAADAYTLAAIYKPDDPLAYAGKSHALFAAGEYMSSALYLSKALTIFPDYVRFKIDIVSMVGDKDKLESRIIDVKEWLTRSNAAELHFLLAYVYYQMDRPDEAKKSINAAYAQMPDVPAVITLKDAIYAAQK